MHGQLVPSIIVTDRELALMNAIERIFPTSRHLLCRWHIGKNLVTNCKKYFETKQKWDLFVYGWNLMVVAETEDEFNRLFCRLNEDFCEYPQVLQYLKITWIDKYKERFISCWTDTKTHFGTTTSNRYI
jgi:histone-lysine N-methyltransferase SETD2